MSRPPDGSRNAFEPEKPGTAARTAAEARIERLRAEGGVFVEAVRATRMPMAITDPSLPGNPVVFANEAFLGLSGYSMDEVLGQQPHFMNGPGTDPADARRFREALEQDRDTVIETVQYRKDGSRFLASVFLSAFKDDEGRTLHQFLSYLDVTARETAEDELAASVLREAESAAASARLAASEARLRGVLDGMAEGFGLLAPDFTILEYNAEALRMDGRALEEIVGRSLWDVLPGSEESALGPLLKRAMTERVPVSLEHNHAWEGGRALWLETRAYPTADGALAVFWRDVTDRRQADAALRESEERLGLAVEVGELSTWDWDLSTGQVTWNDRHYLMQGYEVGEVPPSFEAWLERVHPDDRAAAVARIEAARESRSIYAHQFRILRPDGSVRWGSARGRFFHDEDGVPQRMIGVMEDVTERHEAEARQRLLLEELQHRVRNTLSVLRSIARRTAQTSETVEEFAAHLEGRMTAFARTQAAVTRDPAKGVELAEIVSAELEAHAAREGEAVSLDGPPLALKPKAAEVFGLAVHELATNAVKYGALRSPGGRLDVRWKKSRGQLIFEWSERSPEGAQAPTRRGVGRELLERLVAYELNAETRLTFGGDGVNYVVRAPLDRLTG